MIIVTGLGWFVLEVIDIIDGDEGTDGITDWSTNGVGVGFGVSIFNDAIDEETDDGSGSVDGSLELSYLRDNKIKYIFQKF